MCAFLSVKWCTIVVFVICRKHFFKTSFSSCRQKCTWPISLQGFLIFDMLKTIWKPMIINTYFQSILFENKIHSIDFLCKVIGWTLYQYDIAFIFFKDLFSEYFSLRSLVFLILNSCFNKVTCIKMCIGWLIVSFYWHSGYWDWR